MLKIKKRIPVGKLAIFSMSILVVGTFVTIETINANKFRDSTTNIALFDRYGQTQQSSGSLSTKSRVTEQQGDKEKPPSSNQHESQTIHQTNSQDTAISESITTSHKVPVANNKEVFHSTSTSPLAVPSNPVNTAQVTEKTTSPSTPSVEGTSYSSKVAATESTTRKEVKSVSDTCSGLSLLGLCTLLDLL